MAASPAQIAANAANARHSTGPRTPEGKARSADNARRHGLTARELVIAPEEHHAFEQLLAGFQAEVAPQGAIQHALFDELVASAWNLRRVRRMEADLCAGVDPSDLLHDAGLQSKLDCLARHHTRIERTFHRCLKELKALQTNDVLQASLPRSLRENVPALASTSEIAKRTQFLEEHDPLLAAVMIKALALRHEITTGHLSPALQQPAG